MTAKATQQQGQKKLPLKVRANSPYLKCKILEDKAEIIIVFDRKLIYLLNKCFTLMGRSIYNLEKKFYILMYSDPNFSFVRHIKIKCQTVLDTRASWRILENPPPIDQKITCNFRSSVVYVRDIQLLIKKPTCREF